MSRGSPDGPGTAGPGARAWVARRAGAAGVLVEAADGKQAQALHAEVLRRRDEGSLPGAPGADEVLEVVPAARTVLVDGLADPDAFAAALSSWEPAPPAADAAGTVELPVRFDGPDLAEVARLWGTSPEGVARRLTATVFRVAFCGFAPGFGYLTGLPEELDVPRRATPRPSVAAGSVGLAGPYAGVYPRASPGGWQLVGRTDAVLWDTGRDPAALLSPGTAVRFTEQG